MNKNLIDNARKNILDGLKNFLVRMKLVKDYDTILESLFELHFRLDKKSDLISDLNLNLTTVFNVNGAGLLNYFQFNEIVNSQNLGLDHSEYRKAIDLVNKLKFKYGFMIKKLSSANQQPFLIGIVETNIAANNSLHKMKISRADGESLDCLFNSEVLMQIISTITHALGLSMKQGIYNLNSQTVENYRRINNDFIKYLDKIETDQNLKVPDKTTTDQIATDKN